MDNVEIITLASEKWEQYKNLRLKALKNDPEAFGQTYDQLILRSDEEWVQLLSDSAEGQKRWVLFARLNGELVAMVSGTAMQTIPGGVKIREMFVEKEVRGKGIATKLMQSLIKQLETEGKKILRLGVFKSQKDATNLYKNLGFKIIEEKTENFPNGPSHESLIMEKILA